MKWLYLKVIGWSVPVFVCVGGLVLYAHTVTTSATTASSAPLTLFALTSAAIFALLLFLFCSHNHFTYPIHYA